MHLHRSIGRIVRGKSIRCSKFLSIDASKELSAYTTTVGSIQGRRDYMEDEYVIGGSPSDDVNPKGREFLGVFDGHAGAQVSKHIKENIFNRFQDISNSNKLASVNDILKETLAAMDKEVEGPKLKRVGSTACIAVIDYDNKTLHSANLGDSRIVLGRNGKAIDLTVDHKPDAPFEKKRIESLKGGFIAWDGPVDTITKQPIKNRGCYRVQGHLALSRAIGDHYLRPYVSSDPDIVTHPMDPEDDFIIAATDGFWDVFSSQDAVDAVTKIHQMTKEPTTDENMNALHAEVKNNLADVLVRLAYKFGSYDNITVILKWIRQPK